MSVKIQLRRDISSVWTSRNPILALGEPGFETDTHKLKIGDGTTAWNSLDYVSDGFSGVGGPLDYTYGVSFSANTFVANYDSDEAINNLSINPTSHDIDFSLYYDDLISNSYAINMTLTQVEDADKAILFKCEHIVDLTSSVPPQPYYSFDVTELSRSELFTGFENTKKYYLNIDIKGDSAKFQIASVDLHNGGVQTAQVLQFDNNVLQSVITGPTPPSGEDAKRIIVQGQRAEGGGEGGDVYIWSGDSDAYGGDIKIYAGDADNVAPDSGEGGYVRIDGGKGATEGGNVEITGGYSEGGEGGDVEIRGGYSSGVAGVVNINSNNGNWVFGADGGLTLPRGGIITDDVETVTLSGAGTVGVNQTYRLLGTIGVYVGTTNYLYQIEPREAPSTGYLVRLSSSTLGYYESNDLITWTVIDDGSSPVPTGVVVPQNITLSVDSSSWAFASSSSLTLPSGSIISETNNTISIMPPTAVSGQSLVIRPTQTWSLTSNHPEGFAPGDSITITFTPNIGSFGSFTAAYTFTGCTEEQLGRSLTGSLVYTEEETQSLTWTIPSISDITSFTFTIQNIVFPATPDPFITLSSTGSVSNEPSHLHLIAGNPTTVDLFLGDDDQYVKIGKDGGDVVIGTNSDTNHWTFGADGTLTLPQGGVIDETLNVDTLTLVNAGLVAVNQTYIKTSPVLYTGSNGITIEAIGDGVWLCIQGGDAKYSSTDNLITWGNSTGGLPVPTSTVNPGVETVNITVGNETWTFGTDGTLTLPEGTSFIPYGDGQSAWHAGTGTNSFVSLSSNNINNHMWVDDNAAYVGTNWNAGSKTWTFGTDGKLTFPDNSTQTTAYVPSTPSPALTSIAGLTTASDNYIYTTAPDVYTTGTITNFGRSLVDDTSSSDARSTLGLTIGTDVQAHNEALNKVYKLYRNTTDNSNTVLTTNGESVSGSNILIIPPYAAWNFNIQLVARSYSTNQANSWNFRGCLHRRNDDTVYIVNSVIEENNLESSVSASVVADNSGKALELNVTGLSSTTIAWVATVHITESISPPE